MHVSACGCVAVLVVCSHSASVLRLVLTHPEECSCMAHLAVERLCWQKLWLTIPQVGSSVVRGLSAFMPKFDLLLSFEVYSRTWMEIND